MKKLDERSLTAHQFRTIVDVIWKYHRFGTFNKSERDNKVHRHIKYVRPSFDMRDGSIFYIVFDDTEFDFRDTETSMYERIKEWLEWDEYCEMD